MTTDPSFIHLQLHSEYSLCDGLSSIAQLVEVCRTHRMPALAVTEDSNLYSWVKFYCAMMEAGIKPLLGADIWLTDRDTDEQAHRALLLCQDQLGYQHLSKLLSKAYQQGQRPDGCPVIKRQWLAQMCKGLLVLLDTESALAQILRSNQQIGLQAELNYFSHYFPKAFYLVLHRLNKPGEKTYIRKALELAQKHKIAVVATNNVRFIKADDMTAHEARVCIGQGCRIDDKKRARLYTDQQYLKTPEEMAALFHDLPTALKNSVEIAKRCNVHVELQQVFLPKFPLPEKTDLVQFFESKAHQGLRERLRHQSNQGLTEAQQETYQRRLSMELSMIKKMGYTSYFLIVADFINWARKNTISVGPGRGSGAGSLVAYALRITNIDPLPYRLLFERFLNPERVSMPDFDIDFCIEGRDRVIEYVTKCYGRDKVAQIITFGCMSAKAVVRDVGRTMGYPYGFVDKIAKLIPFAIGMTLDKALEQEERLAERYHGDTEVKALIDLALKLEGKARNVGKHAGGVVISPSILTDFTPLYCEPDGSSLVTQFDKDDIECIGLVKFDFLGLRTLTIIRRALEMIHSRGSDQSVCINIDDIPLDDAPTYALLQAQKTSAVFQLESYGIRNLIARLKPSAFNDIVALVALYRPGPLQSGMVDDFIERKHGRKAVNYLHPKLESILKDTYGVILYQEQVMQIAQILANYSLGEADILRRAMGKKKVKEMAEQRNIFTSRAQKNGIELKIAETIFDLMEKFAGYGFNKSHSVAYALIAYQTAWLKTHHLEEFMAAVLSSDMDNTDKVVLFINDARALGVVIQPPDINKSQYQFIVDQKSEIRYGLGAIKGVGEAAITMLLEQRKKAGVFQDLLDLCQRVNLRKVNRRVLEALIMSGALDSFSQSRETCLAMLDVALHSADKWAQSKAAGQRDFFATDYGTASMNKMLSAEFKKIKINTTNCYEKRLRQEKAVLGWYISGHPVLAYRDEIKYWDCNPLNELRNSRSIVFIVGCITRLKVKINRHGEKMAFGILEDHTTSIELFLFSDVYTAYRDQLVVDQPIMVEGEISKSRHTGQMRLIAQRIASITSVRERYVNHLWLKIEGSEQQFHQTLPKLQTILKAHQGGRCRVVIARASTQGNIANLQLSDAWRIYPSNALLLALRELLEEENVILRYEIVAA